LHVRGRDSRGFAFEEDTSSEYLCRSGAAFRTRFDVAIGSNLQAFRCRVVQCSGTKLILRRKAEWFTSLKAWPTASDW
jgi:hypothetical protein